GRALRDLPPALAAAAPASGQGRRNAAGAQARGANRMSAAPTDLLLAGAPRSSGSADASLLEFELPTAALLATPVRPAARRILWAVVSLVAACAAAAALVPIDMVITAGGRVVAMRPTVVVQPLETAIVREIEAREGQLVRAGQLLARLDPT